MTAAQLGRERVSRSLGKLAPVNWIVLTGLLLASSQAPLGSTLIAVALPQIAESLASDVVHATTLLVSSYLVVTVLFQGPGGRLSDALGHLRTLRIGMALFAAGSVAGALSPNLYSLSLARCLTAVGGSLVVPSTMALIRVTAAPERRGRIFGTFGGIMALSAALGPLIGAELVSHFGWRSIYLASLPFLAAAALLLKLRPPPDTGATGGRGLWSLLRTGMNWPSLALLAAALVLVVSGGKAAGPARPVLLAAGIAAAVAFAVVQWRSVAPVLDVRLMRDPVVAAGTGIMALHNFAMYGLLFQLPAYFEQFHGSSPRAVGRGLFVMMIGMVLASPLGGRLVDRIGPRRAGLAGAALTLAGALLLCRLPSFSAPSDAMPALLVLGIGLGLTSSPAQSSAMAAVPSAKAGMAAGLSSTMRYIGGVATIAVQASVLGENATVTAGQHVTLVVVYAAALALALGAATALPGAAARRGT